LWCQSGDCGYRVRRLCTGRYLPAHLRRILLMEQQVWSLQRDRRSTLRPRVAADNQPCDLVSQGRVEPMVAHPAPPQTRTCAMHASGSSSRAAAAPGAVHWPAVVRVRELKVSPLSPASGCSARRRLPSRGSLGPQFPTFPGTMRRYDCHPAPLEVLRLSLASPIPCLLPSFVVSQMGSSPGGSPRRRQGVWSPGPPFRICGQGDRWLSHVPEFPL